MLGTRVTVSTSGVDVYVSIYLSTFLLSKKIDSNFFVVEKY